VHLGDLGGRNPALFSMADHYLVPLEHILCEDFPVPMAQWFVEASPYLHIFPIQPWSFSTATQAWTLQPDSVR
jgi:hypothetical protein